MKEPVPRGKGVSSFTSNGLWLEIFLGFATEVQIVPAGISVADTATSLKLLSTLIRLGRLRG